jgi:hypothetical protein
MDFERISLRSPCVPHRFSHFSEALFWKADDRHGSGCTLGVHTPGVCVCGLNPNTPQRLPFAAGLQEARDLQPQQGAVPAVSQAVLRAPRPPDRHGRRVVDDWLGFLIARV